MDNVNFSGLRINDTHTRKVVEEYMKKGEGVKTSIAKSLDNIDKASGSTDVVLTHQFAHPERFCSSYWADLEYTSDYKGTFTLSGADFLFPISSVTLSPNAKTHTIKKAFKIMASDTAEGLSGKNKTFSQEKTRKSGVSDKNNSISHILDSYA